MTPLLLLLQAVPATTGPSPAPAAQSWSILVPVTSEPCVPARKAQQDATAHSDDIIVCGRPLPSQKLPYPKEMVPDGPQPSNPDGAGSGALAAAGTPCAAHMGGCQVGIDLFGAATAAVRLAQKAVSPNSCCEDPGEGTNPVRLLKDMAHGVGRAFAAKPDRSKRIAIPLDDVAPTGRGLP